MLRTLLVLEPSTRADGSKCLRGELSRALTTIDHKGGTRHYPMGTPIMLVKNPKGGSYSLLATLPDEVPIDFSQEIAECRTDPDPSYW
ncbi:MAG: hypothetical protein WD851_19605 [Pirellulales bacterium]